MLHRRTDMRLVLAAFLPLFLVACGDADPSGQGSPSTPTPSSTHPPSPSPTPSPTPTPTPSPTPTPTPTPTPSPDAGAPDASTPPDGSTPQTTDYAPYFPTWVWGGTGYAFTSLVDLHQKSGIEEVTLAFVLSGGGCKADQGIEQNIADVKAFVAAGGHVKASFGGADGTYVESQCGTAAELATAIEGFVDATGITDLDFDIEQDPVLTDAVNAKRGAALKIVQDAKHIQVAFTLAANPHQQGGGGGLTSQGISVVKNAVDAGVKVSHVNLMTMDYGDSFAGSPLAPVAIGSLQDANAELMSIVPGLTAEGAWRMLGVIPMIGKNDDSEVFSLDDAKTLAAFAKQNHLGLVSFWSIDRDQVCPSGADYNTCSTVDSKNFAFDALLRP
jgi:chitinase